MLSRATVTVAGLCGRNETKLEGSPSAVRSAEPIAKREAGAARGLARETEGGRPRAPALPPAVDGVSREWLGISCADSLN